LTDAAFGAAFAAVAACGDADTPSNKLAAVSMAMNDLGEALMETPLGKLYISVESSVLLFIRRFEKRCIRDL
jgi:hypothetical protein